MVRLRLLDASEEVDDVIEGPLEIASHLRVAQIPAAVLLHQLKDALPRLGVGDYDHTAKDPTIRWRAENRRTQDAIEQAVRSRVVQCYQVACASAVALSEMRLEPALPIAVSEGRRARGDRELLRHEVIVRDGIGGEMREVA